MLFYNNKNNKNNNEKQKKERKIKGLLKNEFQGTFIVFEKKINKKILEKYKKTKKKM